ncbi:MAG: hypothetical protein ACR5LA_12305, partial [Wolbachia sp.]
RELIKDGVTAINEKKHTEDEVKSAIDGMRQSIIDGIKSVIDERKPKVQEEKLTVDKIRELIKDGVTAINEKKHTEDEVKSAIDGMRQSIIDGIKSVIDEKKPTVNEVKPVICEFKPIIDNYPYFKHHHDQYFNSYHGSPCHSGYDAGWNHCGSGHKVMFNALPDTRYLGHSDYLY